MALSKAKVSSKSLRLNSAWFGPGGMAADRTARGSSHSLFFCLMISTSIKAGAKRFEALAPAVVRDEKL
jgi:hypothetical protein